MKKCVAIMSVKNNKYYIIYIIQYYNVGEVMRSVNIDSKYIKSVFNIFFLKFNYILLNFYILI